MKIVTWNVNSVKQRLPLIEIFIKEHKPDIILLQELKCTDDQFPCDAFNQYNCAVAGQKGFNGVAILSKFPIEETIKGIPDFEDDKARYIEVFTGGYRIISVYVPNGQNVQSEQYPYKLKFYEHLYKHLNNIIKWDEKIIIGGDFNVALTEHDIYNPDHFKGDVPFTIKERQHLNSIIDIGFVDALRLTSPITNQSGPYTFWDYRSRGIEKNMGMRIDYIFLSPNIVSLHKKTEVDIMTRQKEKTSDHAPLICELSE